jgi:DNA-binding GntR family transcriptional regulator
VSPSRKVVDAIRQKIETGEYQPGDRVGSIRQAMDDYDVTEGAAKIALKTLVDEGWLVTGAARDGHRVADTIPEPAKPKLTVEQRLDRLERTVGIADD